MKKTASRVLDWALGVFIVLLLVLQGILMVSARSNHNVPSLFGYSFMQVLTDSMDGPKDATETLDDGTIITKLGPLSLPKGTGIIIEKAAPSSIRVGEAITFYSDRLGAPVTHRVVAIDEAMDGTRTFVTFGDNPASETCQSWVQNQIPCSYPSSADVVSEKDLIGRVIWQNPAFGGFLGVIQSSYFVPLAVLLPLTAIAITSGVNLIKEARADSNKEKAAVAAAFAASGIDPTDEKAVAAFQEKERYKYELKEEMARETAKEKAEFLLALEKEKAKEKKRIAKKLRKEAKKNEKKGQ